jgi:glycosyltransferase involved in cell wall biosynthesis
MTDGEAPPLFSVLICCHNGEAYVGEAIHSALHQTLPRSAYEVLVVDDASTDSTPAILRGFGQQIRVVRTPAHTGKPEEAWCFGLPQTRGQILVPLDHDDLFAPSKLERLKRMFDADPTLGYVIHYVERIGPDGRRIGIHRVIPELENIPDPAERSRRIRARALSMRSFYLGSSFAARRPIFDGPHTTASLSRIGSPDGITATLAAVQTRYRMDVLPEVLGSYRMHPGQFSGFLHAGLRRKAAERHLERYVRRWQWLCAALPGYPRRIEARRARMRICAVRILSAVHRGNPMLAGALLPVLAAAALKSFIPLRTFWNCAASVGAAFLLGRVWEPTLPGTEVLNQSAPRRFVGHLLGRIWPRMRLPVSKRLGP